MPKKARIRLVYVRHPEMWANPLSLGYLKTYSDAALKGRVESDIFELPAGDCLRDPAAAAAAILAPKPQLVGFSCYLWNSEAVIPVVRALKKAAPGVRVLLGGPDASGRGGELLRESGADISVIGEGELTFADLVGRFLSGRPWAGAAGTLALEGGREVAGPPRENIRDLSVIPSPYLAGLFDPKKYRSLVYETSRGCPFKCDFCAWTSKGGLRFFPLDRSLAEAEWIVARMPGPTGVGTSDYRRFDVVLADQDPTLNAPRARRLLEGLRRLSAGKSILWIIFCELGRWTRELAVAGNSENFEFNLGVESVNPEPLRRCGRPPVAADLLERGVEAARRLAPEAKLIFQLMLGLPGDDPRSFLDCLGRVLAACADAQVKPSLLFPGGKVPGELRRLAVNVQPRATIEIFHLAILPGSRLSREGAANGIRWNPRPPYGALAVEGFSPEDFDTCYAALAAVERLTRAVCGQPLVQYQDIRKSFPITAERGAPQKKKPAGRRASRRG